MVTSLRMTLGDCCRGGVRHGLSSTSGWHVSNSPTRTRSRLPSSMPFPNHRPHGNLKVKQWSVRAAGSSSVLPLVAQQKPSKSQSLETGSETRLGIPQGPAHPPHRASSGKPPERRTGGLEPVYSNVIRLSLENPPPISFQVREAEPNRKHLSLP